jgi:hypothetical protein
MSAPLYRAGHRFDGPDGQFYTLTRDVETFAQVKASDFQAGGGAPEPERSIEMPMWLRRQVTG